MTVIVMLKIVENIITLIIGRIKNSYSESNNQNYDNDVRRRFPTGPCSYAVDFSLWLYGNAFLAIIIYHIFT